MTTYNPDKWLVIKVGGFSSNKKAISDDYRLVGSFFGGYTGGNSWRINSGIVRTEYKDDIYSVFGSSDSVYYCHKNTHGSHSYTDSILRELNKTYDIRILEEEESIEYLNSLLEKK